MGQHRVNRSGWGATPSGVGMALIETLKAGQWALRIVRITTEEAALSFLSTALRRKGWPG